MVDVVIVNWNSGTLIKKCLDSIMSSNDFSTINRIYIVDNNSTDSSLENIQHTQVTILRNNQNLGFAKACNRAFKLCDSEYVLLLNPDAWLKENTISDCIGFMDNNRQYQILGCRLLNDEGATSVSCARFPKPIRFFYDATGLSKLIPTIFTPATLMTDWSHNESREVDQVMGAFMFMRSDVFKIAGYFDEEFFVYFEEMDFSKRLNELGGLSYFNYDIVAVHSGGGTTEKVKAYRLFLNLQSRLKYAKKHFSKSGYLFVVFCTFLIEPITRSAQALLKFNLPAVLEVWRGYGMLFKKS